VVKRSSFLNRGDVHIWLLKLIPVGHLRDAPHQDGRVDGERGEVHRSHHGRQGLHLGRVQERERKLSRELINIL